LLCKMQSFLFCFGKIKCALFLLCILPRRSGWLRLGKMQSKKGSALAKNPDPRGEA
jgi:hypothetical protein